MRSSSAVLLVAVIALVSAIVGCGSDSGGLSSDEFASQLEDLCTEQAAFNVSLPQKGADEGLTNDELQKLANENSEEIDQKIEDLDAPSDLKDAQQDLLDRRQRFRDDPPTSPDEYKAAVADADDTYEALGADRCSAYGDASVKVLEGASVADAYKGLPLPGVEGLDDQN